jgi:16S rRNA G966 N2-methylase RsmD
VRIVGGRLKGRVLQGPRGEGIRPTSDRLRETLFNILAHSYDDPVPGARVIDLFAGWKPFRAAPNSACSLTMVRRRGRCCAKMSRLWVSAGSRASFAAMHAG